MRTRINVLRTVVTLFFSFFAVLPCVCTLVQSSGRNRAAVDATHASATTEPTVVHRHPEHRYCRAHPRRCSGSNDNDDSHRSIRDDRYNERVERRDDDDHRVVHHEREHLDHRDELKPRFLVKRDELLLYLRVAGLLRRLRSLE